MPTIGSITSPSPSRNHRVILWKRLRRFERNNRVNLRVASICIILFLIFGRRRQHPTTYPAPSEQLVIPKQEENVLNFAHEHAQKHNLPVYIFYKARSGQLNNQLVSFINALAIAKQANATLVAPFAFYGSESYLDFETGRGFLFHLMQSFDLYVYQAILKYLGLYYKHDQLVGDYIDGTLLNRSQPVVSIMDFRKSLGGDYLRTFSHVLTRRGDAPFFFMTLGKRSLLETNVNVRGETVNEDPDVRESPASRRELDCNFNVSDHFRGLAYRAGVNGNFLFLSKLYRSHSLNCTAKNPYWLQLRRFVQPRTEIRELVSNAMSHWGKVMTIHLRLFPFDRNKFTPSSFCNYLLSHFHHQLQKTDHVYIAYSVSSEEAVEIVHQLRQRLGTIRIITAHDYGDLRAMGPELDKRYTAPLIDMWTAVNSHFFLGRLGSSLSWNVVYWRQSLNKRVHGQSHHFYRLEDFSLGGERNPTDSYGF